MRRVELETLECCRVLVVGAHPDDAEFSAGGTLAALADLGAVVSLVVCTDGARGGRGVGDVARLRAREQTEAARALGVADFTNLGHGDGELVCGETLRAELAAAVRRARPDLVLTHDPRTLWRRFGRKTFLGHTDHRAAGQATLDALYPRARSPNFYPAQLSDGLEPWSPRRLWLFDSAEPDAVVSIEKTLERKLAALACHESQSQSAGGLVEAARGMAEHTGGEHAPAESFLVHELAR